MAKFEHMLLKNMPDWLYLDLESSGSIDFPYSSVINFNSPEDDTASRLHFGFHNVETSNVHVQKISVDSLAVLLPELTVGELYNIARTWFSRIFVKRKSERLPADLFFMEYFGRIADRDEIIEHYYEEQKPRDNRTPDFYLSKDGSGRIQHTAYGTIGSGFPYVLQKKFDSDDVSAMLSQKGFHFSAQEKHRIFNKYGPVVYVRDDSNDLSTIKAVEFKRHLRYPTINRINDQGFVEVSGRPYHTLTEPYYPWKLQKIQEKALKAPTNTEDPFATIQTLVYTLQDLQSEAKDLATKLWGTKIP